MGFHRGPKIVTNGLVLYLDAANKKSYPGTGTAWSDLSGLGNTGTLTNGPTFNSGNGGSIVFDGVNDYASLPYTSLLNLGNQLTICGFVKLNSISGTNSIFASVDVQTGTFTEGYNFYFNNSSVYGLNANTLRFQFGKSTWSWNVYASNGITISDTNWHFVGLTASSLNTNSPNINFYIDSSQILGTFWNAATKGAIRYSSNINSTRVSSIYYPTNPSYESNYGNNNIAHLSVYNRALSSSEILQNYNATKSRFNL